jgi:cytochrome c oxidase assembly factor CtaG
MVTTQFRVEVDSILNFVGSSFKERVVEFILVLSGILFYHLIIRPKDFLHSRKTPKD